MGKRGKHTARRLAGSTLAPPPRSPEFLRALARRKAHIAEARENVNNFVEYVFERPDGRSAKQGAMHREWHALADRYPMLMLVAPRHHWKCLPPDETTTLADGTRCKAKDLPPRFKTLTWSPDRGWVIAAAECRRNKAQPIHRITTRPGRSASTSPEHPYYTARGWVEAKDLRPGDYVATARGAQVHAKGKKYDLGRAWLAGFLLGDGGLSRPSKVRLTCASPKHMAMVREICAENGWSVRREFGDINYCISGGVLQWLRSLGMHGHTAHHKTIPEQVWSWRPEAIAALIAGYMEADGSVYHGRAGRTVWFASVSRELLAGVQSLLIRLGVQSTMGKRVDKAGRKSWYLRVTGSPLQSLAGVLPAGPKADALRAMVGGAVHNDKLDIVPEEIVARVPGRFRRIRPRLDVRRKGGHQRWKVLARVEEGTVLHREAQLCWEEVVEHEVLPRRMTYAITVPGVETHLAGDFITHNTGQALARAMFKLGRDRNQLIKVLCQSNKKGKKRLMEIRSHFKDNDNLHRVFPHLDLERCVEVNKDMITIERSRRSPDPSLEAIGITSAGTGDRATGIIADDVVDRRNALTLPKIRETIKANWDDWLNLLDPQHGWLFWICTLWHRADLTHHLMANPAYAVARYDITQRDGVYGSYVRFPDGTERVEPGVPLWGDADEGPFGQGGLAFKRSGMTARQFARSFSNQPIADNEMTVDPEWIHYWDEEGGGGPPEDHWPRIVSLDLATTQSIEADYTGVVVLAINPDRPEIKVESAFHVKYTFPQKVQMVLDLFADYEPEFIVVELASGGHELMEHMMANFAVPLRGVRPRGANKGARLESITPYLSQAIIKFNPELRDRTSDESDLGDPIGEILEFKLQPHDDILDALTHGVRFAVPVYSLSAGTDPDDDTDDLCPKCGEEAVEQDDTSWLCEKCGWRGEDHELVDLEEDDDEDDDTNDDSEVLII